MINPIAFSIGPIDVHWYGISYGLSLAFVLWMLTWMNKKDPFFKDSNQIFDFAFWTFLLGVVLGGRLGYILFYNLEFYLQNPLNILKVWQGGMSFHGGFIGAAIVAYFFAKKQTLSYIGLADRVAVPGALATSLTRIANFINQELVGRVIESDAWKWLGVDYGEGVLRYPSQFLQSAAGLILFAILFLIWRKKPKTGVLISSYLMLYGFFRFIIEFVRQPDAQIGFVLGPLSMGQVLSGLMAIVGAMILIRIKKSS